MVSHYCKLSSSSVVLHSISIYKQIDRNYPMVVVLLVFGFFGFCFCLFRAASEAYGGSQARGLIGATAAGLHHSHSRSNVRSDLCLRLTAQLMAVTGP